MPAQRSGGELAWEGGDIRVRFKRAIARGTISVSEQIAARAKVNVHKVTGDLARSIHAAKADTLGDQEMSQQNVLTEEGTLTEVGSWLAYACVEEVGRGHQYMMPAVEAVRGTTARTFRAAFKQEGF